MSRTTRREFLHASTIALVGVPVLGGMMPVRAASAGIVGANEKVRVGLIGCGGIGRVDLGTFLLNPEVDCPVVCDVDDAQLAKVVPLVEGQRGHKPETVKDFRRVIDRKDVDVVVVATPDHWHALPTVYACQAGKDVYVEKPLGRSIHEGRAMVTAARENKRVVQMGTQWRSSEHFREAVEFVRSGKIGKVRLVRAGAYLDGNNSSGALSEAAGNPPDCGPPAGVDYDMWLGPAPSRPFNPNRFHRNFRWYWDYAGGPMTDWGVHSLDVCLWAMGPEIPLRVSSSGGRYELNDDTETPGTQMTMYDFPSYSLVFEHMFAGGLEPGGRVHSVLFSGADAMVIVGPDGWRVISDPKKKPREFAQHEAKGDGRVGHVRNFLDCVKSRQEPVEHVDAGHLVSTVAHLGNVAFRVKREIRWDADAECVIDDREADQLVRCDYRKPWTLPYA